VEDECGFDMLGAEVTRPTAGANYTDAKTVTAVQYALVKKGYNLGDTGPTKDGVDGVLGPKTAKAIKQIQAIANSDVNGRIDETVIMSLHVTPGVLPPGVTAQGRAAVQAQVALDAATRAEHAQTPGDVVQAAQAVVDMTVFEPVEIKLAAQQALTKAKQATTPAQVQAAAQDVKAAALVVHEAVKPSWWTLPAWAGGWPRWQITAIAGGGIVAAGTLLAVLASSGTPAAVVAAVSGPMRALKRRGVG